MQLVIFILILGAVGGLLEALFSIRRQKIITRRLNGEIEKTDKSLSETLRAWATDIGNKFENSNSPFIKKLLTDSSKKLRMAGIMDMRASSFLGIQVLAGCGTVIASIVALGIYDWVILLMMLILGAFIPPLILNSKIKKRRMLLFKCLPDALDILTLLVEAGLDFGAAFNILIENEKGELIDEFYLAQQEIKLGKNRLAALTDMAKRVNYRPLSSVINALVQSMQTGATIGPTIRALSDQFRGERAMLAEKMGQEAPMKMMMPLILLIFPTIFIIIFGPIVLSFLSGKVW
ncbi:MAG: type II secretion system F family protein [Elusimicrobiota bacterium]|nr:type II secretion system F family protein [Elusimicrobiota bacterium]